VVVGAAWGPGFRVSVAVRVGCSTQQGVTGTTEVAAGGPCGLCQEPACADQLLCFDTPSPLLAPGGWRQ
jgi:hypothetical protein